MNDAAAQRARRKADLLLLEHCFALDRASLRPPARARLERRLGSELTRRLVAALGERRRSAA